MFFKINKPNQADLICMRELLLRNKEWDFYMNLASSELPLMVMGEIEELVRERNTQKSKYALNPFKDNYVMYGTCAILLIVDHFKVSFFTNLRSRRFLVIFIKGVLEGASLTTMLRQGSSTGGISLCSILKGSKTKKKGYFNW